MSPTIEIDQLINSLSEQELNNGFDENIWDETINSIDFSEEDSLMSEQCETPTDRQNIVKLSIVDKISNFSYNDRYINIDQPISILVSPFSKQRVRYEKECDETLRYVSVPQNGTITIQIPDLRSILLLSNVIWMRITRITCNDGIDKPAFYHPYPIWIKNKNAKIHHGSIFLRITENDITSRLVKIDNLTMIRLKQKDLAKIKTLPIYSLDQLDFVDSHSISDKTAKQIRDEYNLRCSILTFQLICVDENNNAYPTRCFCRTEPLREIDSHEQQ